MQTKVKIKLHPEAKAGQAKIIAIVGPTASGKTDLAIHLAKKFNAEVISADSRQIYQGMDTGTAKPSKKEQKLVRHYLIDIKKINQPFSVHDFKKLAIKTIKEILRKRKLPILAGGTGLYIKSVVDNLELPKIKPNKRLRLELEKELKEKGLSYMFEKLIKLDPEAIYIVDLKNPRRVLRALEITLSNGIPFSKQRKTKPPLFNFLQIGIFLAKEELKKRIQKRVDKMTKNGLIKETKNLAAPYLSPEKQLPEPLTAIGYREIIDYLRGKISLTQAKEQIKQNTWLYAKRQITWFKKDKRIVWLKAGKHFRQQAEKLIKNFLKT